MREDETADLSASLPPGDDPLFFLDEVKMVRTAALVATSLTSLRRLELLGRNQRLQPGILAGFAKLAAEATDIRQRLARDRAPIMALAATDPAARRLVERAETLISQLDELVDLVARLRAGQAAGGMMTGEDHQRRP